jgi:molybdopterin synthase catalytic subunit
MIKVQRDPFDMGEELSTFSQDNHSIGGVCAFMGQVRDMAEDASVSAMTLEHYPGMTEKALEKIEAEAHERWELEKTLIIHRYGRLDAGDPIVLVVVASAHRAAAFDACRFLMDWLKTQAPFWKQEETDKGPQWVVARQSDDEAASRWGDVPANAPESS